MADRRISGDPELDKLMREARELETGKKESEPEPIVPPKTFLEYQQQATMYNNYKGLNTPVLGLHAAMDRLSLAAAHQMDGRPVKEELIASDLAHVLYYLSALCDQTEVTLEKVAEISLNQLRQHEIKKLRK
jgi:hypothetical protein